MTTFARIEGGYTVDAQIASTVDEVLTRYSVQYRSGKTWVVVPDGTQSSAFDNGDGTFTNPPSAPKSPKYLRHDQIIDLIPDAVFKAWHDSLDAQAIKQFERFKTIPGATKDEAQRLWQHLKNKAGMLQAEIDTANAAWPEG